MRKKKNSQWISLLLMCVVSVGIIFGVSSLKIADVSAVSGTLMDISGMNAEAYQVSQVAVLEDGSYVVYVTSKGFGGDIETAITFEKSGETVSSVIVVAQSETDGLGSKITEADFLSSFEGIAAPVMVADMKISSPTTGSINSVNETAVAEVTMEETTKETKGATTLEWNAGDNSPEAMAVRNLYTTGLLESARTGEELSTSYADSTPEDKAIAKLSNANLLSAPQGLNSGVVMVAGDVDAITGATISSKAVALAVNNGYFFLMESGIK